MWGQSGTHSLRVTNTQRVPARALMAGRAAGERATRAMQKVRIPQKAGQQDLCMAETVCMGQIGT